MYYFTHFSAVPAASAPDGVPGSSRLGGQGGVLSGIFQYFLKIGAGSQDGGLKGLFGRFRWLWLPSWKKTMLSGVVAFSRATLAVFQWCGVCRLLLFHVN